MPAALVISPRNRRGPVARARLPGPGGRFDQLDHRPDGQPQLVGVFAALFGRGQRLVILAQAVVQHRTSPVRQGDPDALAPQRHVPSGGPDQRGRLQFPGRAHSQGQGAVGREVAARSFGRRLHLLGQRRRGGQLAGEQQQEDAGAEGQGKLAERADLAGQLDVPPGQHIPLAVIPQMQGRDARQPQPPKLLLGRHLVAEGPAPAAGAAIPPGIRR